MQNILFYCIWTTNIRSYTSHMYDLTSSVKTLSSQAIIIYCKGIG